MIKKKILSVLSDAAPRQMVGMYKRCLDESFPSKRKEVMKKQTTGRPKFVHADRLIVRGGKGNGETMRRGSSNVQYAQQIKTKL